MANNVIRSTATAVLTTVGALALAATAHATTPALHGNPTAAAPYWRHQTLDDCALMATADVVGQLTGNEPSERAIIKVAKSTASQAHPGSVYIPPTNTSDPNSGNGTDPADIPQLLAHYHLHGQATDDDHAAKTGVPTGLDALAADLDAGRKVITGVNAELLWRQSGDTTHADHAVVVTGLDTARNIVHLNDSGNPSGRDEQIDLNTFVKSWQTSDNFLIVATK